MELLYQNLVEPIPERSRLKTIIRNLHPSYLKKFPGNKITSIDKLKVLCKNIEDLRYNLEKRAILASRDTTTKRPIAKFDKSRKIYSLVNSKVTESNQPEMNAKSIDSDVAIELKSQELPQHLSLISTPKLSQTAKCWNCRKEGHTYYQCKVPKTKIFCCVCGKDGFISRLCPNCIPPTEKNK